MQADDRYVRWLETLSQADVPLVGGKNASLGEMIRVLKDQGILVPDGFSIGGNDLTQLVLGVDRDSAELSEIFDERDEAVKRMVQSLIATAHQAGRKVGLCSQAPSDYPDFTEFLVECGIDSISLNPDSVIKMKHRVAQAEARK